MITEVYIEGQRLDLYDDENITVKQIAKDLKDISKIFSDFSQSFNVPASATNNNIFKHYYNANIDGGYDARTRKDANIVVGGFDFKWGKMRLDSVQINNNVPAQYKITFFGNTVNIKDLLGDDKLFDLEWLDNFNDPYNGTKVLTGLTNGISKNVDGVNYLNYLIFPLISYRRQFFYNSDTSVDTNTDTLVNIAYDLGSNRGVDYTDLKPAITLNLIIRAIEEQYGFSFNSPFFDSDIFQKIYMNLNDSVESLATGSIVVEELEGVSIIPDNSIRLKWNYNVNVTPKPGFENTPYKKKLTLNGVVTYEDSNFVTGFTTANPDTEQNLDIEEYSVKFEIITEGNFEFDCETALDTYFATNTFGLSELELFNNFYVDQAVILDLQILEQMPDIKVYDFLTSLFKTFNLIATSEGKQITIQDLPSWYTDGNIYDVTQFIETKSETVNRGTIFKQINFKFEESDQILSDEFRQSNNQGYGDLDFILSDENGDPLRDVDGEVLDVQSIFENPIYERLNDLNDGSQTNLQYCLYTNREIEPIVGKPFIFYAIKPDTTDNPIGFITESSELEVAQPVFMPSHSQFVANSFNLNFNAEISEYSGTIMQDTIYNRFWSDYVGDMFSIKRRNYKFEGKLPINLLNNLRLNDRLIIKGTRYIINSISSNIVDRQDTFELINDIYSAPLASDSLNTSLFRQRSQTFNNEESDSSVNYIGLEGKTVSAIDYGDGTAFLSLNDNITRSKNDEIRFKVQSNSSGVQRVVGIRVLDDIKNPVFVIIQEA